MPSRTPLVLAVILAAAVAGCASPPPAPPPPTVIVYGDSLVQESYREIIRELQAARPGARVAVRALGGTAQCDWHHHMVNDAATIKPAAVIIAFVGNNLTTCATSRTWPDLYGDDADWAVAHWKRHGAHLLFIGAPAPVGESTTAVSQLYEDAAQRHGVPFVSLTPLFSEGGVAVPSVPCRPEERSRTECRGGKIVVRNPDGLHLCPKSGSSTCPVYSAGAHRYGVGIAEAYTTHIPK